MKMELRRLYLVITCAVLIPSFETKTFSINEAIAAEVKRNQGDVTQEEATERSLFDKTTEKLYTPFKSLKLKRKKIHDQDTDGSFPGIKTFISPKKSKFKSKLDTAPGKTRSHLKYRKAFQITSPIKPKKLGHLLNPLYRHRYHLKRDIGLHKNENNNKKYIPLIRSLSVLFDNLLAGSGDTDVTNEITDSEGYNSNRKDVVCKCALKSDVEAAESKPRKKTITAPEPPPTQVPIASETAEVTTPATYPTTASNISRLRKNKILPVLLSRNTFSSRRNNNGLDERSSPALYRSIERDIARNNGNHEHNTEDRTNSSDSTGDGENSRDVTRDSQSGDKYRRRVRGNRNVTGDRVNRIRLDGTTTKPTTTKETTVSEKENASANVTNRRSNFEPKRHNQLEIYKHKTESQTSVPEPVRGVRRFVSKDKISNDIESVSSEKPDEEGDNSIPLNNPSDKRVTDRSSSYTRENQNDGPIHETLVSFKDLTNSTVMLQEIPNKKKNGVVMIIDGYSIARDKNGENKLAKKTIHFHS